ncbi:MAG: hypothetical protein E3J81_03580 [Dehalococcoidia bacterium]|nr:MAG: hypothetical protein E3J81_03580 [Dehalococcoidia bacterium]
MAETEKPSLEEAIADGQDCLQNQNLDWGRRPFVKCYAPSVRRLVEAGENWQRFLRLQMIGEGFAIGALEVIEEKDRQLQTLRRQLDALGKEREELEKHAWKLDQDIIKLVKDNARLQNELYGARKELQPLRDELDGLRSQLAEKGRELEWLRDINRRGAEIFQQIREAIPERRDPTEAEVEKVAQTLRKAHFGWAPEVPASVDWDKLDNACKESWRRPACLVLKHGYRPEE